MMDEDIREVRELVLGLGNGLTELRTEHRALRADVEAIKHVLLEGNGTPPMTVRVALLESEIDRVREERTDRKVPRAVWVGIALSTVVGIAAVITSLL